MFLKNDFQLFRLIFFKKRRCLFHLIYFNILKKGFDFDSLTISKMFFLILFCEFENFKNVFILFYLFTLRKLIYLE